MSEEIANHSEQATQTIETQEVVTATPETVTTQITESTGIPIKFNGEEKVVSLEEAPTLIQKGMNYDKAIERAKQEARDSYIADQGYTFNGQPIKTEAEYNNAVKQQEQQEFEETLKAREIPQAEKDQIIADRKFRQENEPVLTSMQAKIKQESDFKAFYEAFPTAKAEDIPANMWTEYANGGDLVQMFTRHENATLKQKLAEFTQKQQVEQLNQINAETSTGSVTGNGAVATAHFTQDQVAAMSQNEVNQNWTAINESMKKW